MPFKINFQLTFAAPESGHLPRKTPEILGLSSASTSSEC